MCSNFNRSGYVLTILKKPKKKVKCPRCGSTLNVLITPTEINKWYKCGPCGRLFKVGSNKYNAISTSKKVDGYGWDSKAEADYYFTNLLFREKAGEIKDIKRQNSIEILPDIFWKLDFTFTELTPKIKMVAKEFKGVEGERYRILLRLWKLFGPMELRIAKGSLGKFRTVKVIKPGKYKIELIK